MADLRGPNFNYPQTEPFNFLGLDIQDYDSSKVVVLPVPYNSTTYWKSGTKDGPRAIIEASRHLELWDEELKKDSSEVGVFTLGEVQVSKNSPKETIDRVTDIIAGILKDNKFPLMLGGEHSLALAGAAACAQKYRNLSVLQLDAHTDSRFEFEDTLYSHATTMRRVVEDLKIPVTHVGIRSHSKEEAEFFKKSKLNNIFYAPELPVSKILATLKKNVYLTFDLDAFDTSIMPAVGTPEPGGIGWYETLALLKKVAQKHNIVGCDIVELDPIPGQQAPDFLAAKLAYKLIGYRFL
ncbi:agmatinase [Candidatus Curtissbacteria bacterium]|nr:agmatinase [Candidatus Curtissbacteria bacterium]